MYVHYNWGTLRKTSGEYMWLLRLLCYALEEFGGSDRCRVLLFLTENPALL